MLTYPTMIDPISPAPSCHGSASTGAHASTGAVSPESPATAGSPSVALNFSPKGDGVIPQGVAPLSFEQNLLLEGYRIVSTYLNTTDSRDWKARVERLFRSQGHLVEFKLEPRTTAPVFQTQLMARLKTYDTYVARDVATGRPL